MQKFKTEKGITLIALIITIIVMLILVGVTVSISLNGGLFTTAKDATNKTQLEIDKEQLLELALGAMDKTGEITTPSEITKHGTFTFADGVYTSVKSGNKFTVGKWGSVAEAPDYTLSGKWNFDSRIDMDRTNTIISQEMNFTLTYFVRSTDEESGIDTFVETTGDFSLLEVCYYDTDVEILCDGSLMYGSAGPHWKDGESDPGFATVLFTEPQMVTQEFYEWFTANATPVTE